VGHTVTVTGLGIKPGGGTVAASFSFTARESITISAYITYKGQTSETAHASGSSGTLLIPGVNYSGDANSGEILTVCVLAAGQAESERKCYEHEIIVSNTPLFPFP
jgi:hypothetical protein